MNMELVWIICPVVAFLSQMGGTFNKLYRRLGVPAIITLTATLFLGWSWWWPVLFLCVFGVATLPVTLIGDGIPSSWVNWVWLWVLGYLMGIPCLLIYKYGYLYALISMVSFAVPVSLSNIKATAHWFPWKFVEGFTWFMMAYCYAIAISMR